MGTKNSKEINIFRYTIHNVRIYNYNDESYKWRPVIPIKKVYNSWIVIPLFTEKERFSSMKNYFLLEELSNSENIFVDLSRQDKILLSEKNFEKYPIRYKNNKWYKIKKSTIKLIQLKQNIYLYGELSIFQKNEIEFNEILNNSIVEEDEFSR